jgi:hypothetical protein
LEFDVVAFVNVVNTDVHLCASGGCSADFLTQEEVRIAPQGFGGIDGIVIRNSNQVHAALFQSFVDGAGITVALAANPPEHRYGTHTRMKRMDVQIASHTLLIAETVLRFDYVLKTFLKKNV